MAGVTLGSVTSYISASVAVVTLGSVTSYISASVAVVTLGKATGRRAKLGNGVTSYISYVACNKVGKSL